MDVALPLVVLVSAVIAFSALARNLGFSAPLLLMVVGIAASFIPRIPDLELTPETVLIGLLPPLLYTAALGTGLVDFARNKGPILSLSVGLVIATMLGIGAIVHLVVPGVTWPVAFAVGAVVAPPDAVAASAVARRVGLPRRLVTILEGESLVNDATAIVSLRTAMAAMAGAVSVVTIGVDFLVSAAGGVLVGLIVAYVVGRIRVRIEHDLTDVSLSLLTPWLAYIPAEELHLPGSETTASGVLAVVTAALVLGHRSPVIQSASSRVFERTNWATVTYLLENSVFLLIGLQMRSIFDALRGSSLSWTTIATLFAATLAGVIVIRLVWVVFVGKAIRLRSHDEKSTSLPERLVIAWAGMRGVVTLAVVFALPHDVPHREVYVATAFVVTAGTLLIQGTTLPAVVRLLHVTPPDPHEELLQEATVYQQVSNAGLAALDEHLTGDEPQEVVERLRDRTESRANSLWERLGGDDETPSVAYARLRRLMLRAEREAVLAIRDRGDTDDWVLRSVLGGLDVEETMLVRAAGESTADREEDLVPRLRDDGCEHLREATRPPTPMTPEGCEECLRDGTSWVHLRLCMDCGHVGCCDSSPQRHASHHFEDVAHPVMRSFEAGEAWRWCFVDRVIG